MTERDVLEATIAGSVLRLRPKLMTVSVVMAEGYLEIFRNDAVAK